LLFALLLFALCSLLFCSFRFLPKKIGGRQEKSSFFGGMTPQLDPILLSRCNQEAIIRNEDKNRRKLSPLRIIWSLQPDLSSGQSSHAQLAYHFRQNKPKTANPKPQTQNRKTQNRKTQNSNPKLKTPKLCVAFFADSLADDPATEHAKAATVV